MIFNELLIVLFHILLCDLGAELEVGQSTAPATTACSAREAAWYGLREVLGQEEDNYEGKYLLKV